jgi:hypothetical protein
MSDSLFMGTEPRREWLLRCEDHNYDHRVCVVTVDEGQIVLSLEEGEEMIKLGGDRVPAFEAAWQAAKSVAALDLSDTRTRANADTHTDTDADTDTDDN